MGVGRESDRSLGPQWSDSGASQRTSCHPEMGARGQPSHVVGSLGCLETGSVPVLDTARDQQLGPGQHAPVSRHLDPPLLGTPGGGYNPGFRTRRGRPFTTSPPLAPPRSCLAFIWQNGAYQSHQLNKHTNPRLVRKNTQPELFISCSQALHTAHCQKHRRGPEAGQRGLSSLLWRWRVASPTPASVASLLPSLSLAHHQWVDISELLPTQNPPVSAFSLGTMGQLVACGTAEGQGWYWLTQGRQVPLHLLSRPAQPILDTVTGSPVCYGHIPWGLFLLQPLILAGMEARMAAPASVSGQSGPGWEKGKKLLPAPTLQSLGLLPLPSEKEPGQRVCHHLPWTRPKTVQ